MSLDVVVQLLVVAKALLALAAVAQLLVDVAVVEVANGTPLLWRARAWQLTSNFQYLGIKVADANNIEDGQNAANQGCDQHRVVTVGQAVVK